MSRVDFRKAVIKKPPQTRRKLFHVSPLPKQAGKSSKSFESADVSTGFFNKFIITYISVLSQVLQEDAETPHLLLETYYYKKSD